MFYFLGKGKGKGKGRYSSS